jgi:DNA-binding NarL/FixJ family response regulator
VTGTTVERKQADFAEVLVDQLRLESFANEQSAYHTGDFEPRHARLLDKYRGRLKYHISHSLSKRQQQVIKAYLRGERERQIAVDLGVKQQVVNTYKHRAIKKLQKILTS